VFSSFISILNSLTKARSTISRSRGWSFCLWILIFIGNLFCLSNIQASINDYTWEVKLADFSFKSYNQGIEDLVSAYEKKAGASLLPKAKGKIALKIYTGAGLGFCTPHALTQAVIACLERRGFKEIYIVDQFTHCIRASGYLPPLGEPQTGLYLDKYPVCALDTNEYYDPQWFYENPLPSMEPSALFSWGRGRSNSIEEKRSYLPTILLETDVDYWINLPVGSDLPSLGVCCALGNATLWAVSNSQRLIQSPATTPIAVSEIAAIPELREPWIFTIVSLQYYQVAAGPVYNAYYTKEEPLVWLSANPVMLDYALLQRMNQWRRVFNFPPYSPIPQVFPYAASVGLGGYSGNLTWVKLQSATAQP
jgi:hypothetical protein